MMIRAAVVGDAPELGRVMVESWLSAHRDQMPHVAWQRRADEWTADVSGRGWARVMADQVDGSAPHDVLLVAEDDSRAVQALVYGTPADDDVSGAIAEIGALYVSPDRRGQGIGAALLRAGARELAQLGFTTLRLSVLTANRPARGFYEAMGAHEIGQGTFDEEGCLLPVTVYEWSDVNALVGE
ncbi:GNAT family N-acetyltransferase [Nocardioides sp.]|uniref:GNAT family N-acetyltransferase n=1 Tax=Nocardioides sp. TaxID=35761 RepID=UPI00286DCB41|nr:GNAT family N-acetyltransferase [Nocardioides sp.]